MSNQDVLSPHGSGHLSTLRGETWEVHRRNVLRAAKACAARAFDQMANSNSQKMWQGHADELNACIDAMDSAALEADRTPQAGATARTDGSA